MNRLLALLIIVLLTGCASTPTPPLARSHPASPEAAEGATVKRLSSLRPDEATRKSRALLTSAQKEQEQWDAYGPVSGTSEEAPAAAKKMEMNHKDMKHEH